MLDRLDPFRLKQSFDRYNVLSEAAKGLVRDARFVRTLRRALLPIPGVDVTRPRDSAIFPPLEKRPHPVLAGKRVGLVASGGSGAQVALCGVKRALEEADVSVAAISVCSGSAIWGSMIAAGLSAQQMVDECLAWRATDIVDVDWGAIARFPWRLGRGFGGLVRGEAVERTLGRATGGATLASAPIPYYAIVLNVVTNQVEYFGPHNHPDVPLARMTRVAIALPLFVHPVRFGEHDYVDGGVVNIFPVEPLLRYEQPFDSLIGVNVIMPPGFMGEDISGWLERPISILEVSRQLCHSQWLELARAEMDKVRDRMLLLEPLPYTEIVGSRFYEILVDSSRWTEHILTAYRYTRERLDAFTG